MAAAGALPLGNLTPILDGAFGVDFIHQLGHGGFGTVHKGYDNFNQPFAIKKINRDEDENKAITETAKLLQLKDRLGAHENIVPIFDIRYWNRSIWVIMELCDLGDLNKYFHNHLPRLTTQKRVNIMQQTMSGIAYLHSQDIVHRDIKPANIVAKSTRNGVVIKLADFGLCKVLDDNQTSTMHSNVGTMAFKAPEFWDPQTDERIRYHHNVDVYAAGLTFTAIVQAVPGSFSWLLSSKEFITYDIAVKLI